MTQELPPLIKKSDTEWPSYKTNDRVVKSLTFYKTERLGWIIATLPIGSGGKFAQRTYAISLNGSVCRAGKGPHVKAVIEVHVRQSREAALKKYLDLYEKGMGDAGMVRDRIGSRRAEGQVRRARGETYWRWDN